MHTFISNSQNQWKKIQVVVENFSNVNNFILRQADTCSTSNQIRQNVKIIFEETNNLFVTFHRICDVRELPSVKSETKEM